MSMYFKTIYDLPHPAVVCDRCGIKTNLASDVGTAVGAAERDGWRISPVGDGPDFCPTCREERL